MPITLTHDDALMILERKVRNPGDLQIITATHQCLDGDGNVRGANRKGFPSTPEEADACVAYCRENTHPAFASFDEQAGAWNVEPLSDPAHFVCLDVVRIEGPDAKGRYSAFAEDGSFTMGYPANLLSKLTEAPARRALPDPE